MIGELLNHYRILEQIGVGGMGAVYRAEDQKLRREVALKLLPSDVTSNSERLERFLREARSVASLNHPNIVTLHSVENAKEHHFITMELVKGQPLNRHIPRGGLPLNRFLEIAIALADAIAAAHEKGITHRDLKPGNVMIDDSGRVKVIDFGLAKAAASAPSSSDDGPTQLVTMEGRIMGTPAYMSPEQVEGRSVDHRADIFALGILGHEMLTGELPFKGGSNMSVMSAILRDEPSSVTSLRPDVPPEISRLIRRCLQKQPNERIQSALDVRNELKDLQKEFISGVLSSQSATRLAHAPPAAPKRTFGPGRIALAVVLVLATFGFWKLGNEKPGSTQKTTVSPPGNSADVPTTFPQVTRLSSTDRLEAMPAWSPDGKQIAYVATVGKFRHIFVRELRSSASVQLTQSEHDHIHPAWGSDLNTIYYSRTAKAGTVHIQGDLPYGGFNLHNSSIFRHDLKSGELQEILQNSGFATVAPGGTALFFVQNNRIFRSDLNGNRVVQLSDDEDHMTHADPKVSFDGSKVVFRRFNFRQRQHHLAVVTTNQVMTLVRTNGFNLYPCWHPSGRHIYFSFYRGSGMNIWRFPVNPDNTPAGEPVPVTVGGGPDVTPVFSPDGRRLAFSITSQNADIYRVALDPATGTAKGTPAERLPFNSNSEDGRASWAPRPGPAILAFNSDRDGDMNLYIWREADNTTTRVTSGTGGDYQPTWSPDLQKLTFFSSRNGNADIFVVSTNANSTPVRLTQNPVLDYNPFFSPDGKRILFASERGSHIDLYLMNSDGSDQRLLLRNAAITHFHVWYDNDRILNQVEADTEWRYCFISATDGRIEKTDMVFPIPRVGGHGSLSPDRKMFMDLDYEHSNIWVLSVNSNDGRVVYRKPHPSSTLDYPWWSPDGNWATFDYILPRNSELYVAEWPSANP